MVNAFDKPLFFSVDSVKRINRQEAYEKTSRREQQTHETAIAGLLARQLTVNSPSHGIFSYFIGYCSEKISMDEFTG